MKLFLLLFFCACISISFAQDKNQFYALDAQMNQTVMDSSKYILWIHQKEDSNWEWDYYITWGPLIKSRSFADHDGTILNGRSSFYNSSGNLDSTGNFAQGKKNGDFYKLRSYAADSVIKIKKYKYVQDSLVEFTDLRAESHKKKVNDSAIITQAEYPGGALEWDSYLSHNLKYPERAMNRKIQGKVSIYFAVDEVGAISDLIIEKSVEFSIDQESVRLIQNSGKWTPATRNGAGVKTYLTEPVSFGLKEN
jgi:TonB family protein